MNPRTCLCLAVFLLAGGVLWAGTTTQPRPNIVLIISDDQGAGDYGFMGHPYIRTPHLDRLAAESLVFPRGFVVASVCCPSLATIITGRYPHQHGVTANDPPAVAGGTQAHRGSSPELAARWDAALDRQPTLPRLLATAGYLSFQTGKWWHGDFRRGGFTHGMTKGTRHGDEGLTIGREGLQPAFDFITRAQAQQRPFLLWYAPFMPHSPHNPPERLWRKYADKTSSLFIARYWAMCEWFDETCGELLEYLERTGGDEGTLVVYLADNGWVQAPEREAFAPKNKTTPFDRGHRTPIMIRWRGRVSPGRSQSLATSLDLLPTLLAALGLPQGAGFPGANLLDGAARQSRQHVFGECFTIRSRALDDPAANLLWRWVTDGRWRLIVPRTAEAAPGMKTIPPDSFLTPDLQATLRNARPMLYDLSADPDEDHDLAQRYPAKVADLRARLDAVWTPRPFSPRE
jgi:uncharacterized sulfatase